MFMSIFGIGLKKKLDGAIALTKDRRLPNKYFLLTNIRDLKHLQIIN